MKKRWMLFALCAIYISLLGGCKHTSEKEVPVSEEIPQTAEDANEQEEREEQAVPPVNEVPPIPDIAETIFAKKIPWGESEVLYDVPTRWLNGTYESEIHRYGNDLLITHSRYDKENGTPVFEIKLISLKTGEILFKQELGALLYGTVQILDGKIAVNDLGDGKSYVLNEKLELLNTYKLEAGRFCLHPTEEAAYQFTYSGGIKKTNLVTGEETILMADTMNAYMDEVNDTEATFSYTDMQTLRRENGILNLETGQIEKVESPYAYSEMETDDRFYVGRVDAGDPIYMFSDGADERLFYTDYSTTVSINNAAGLVVIEEVDENGNTVFSAYDQSGVLKSRCEATGLYGFLDYDFAWYEEYQGFVFTLNDKDGQAHLMFWDISGENAQEILPLETIETRTELPEESAVSQTYFEQAEALSKKYDVKILIAEQCDTVFSDHRAELLLDEREIGIALSTMDQVMGMYPEGFFSQLKHNTYREVEIQILGVLEKDYSTETEKYISGGFVTTVYPGKLLMALDARWDSPEESFNGILAETMYHEISHMIDKRLDFYSQCREDALYSEIGWLSLNPEGYEYNDTYYGTLDPQYEDYFIDAYACTNSTEDRARIMEYAMDQDAYPFTEKQGVAKKLNYYCAGIREAFNTTGWPKVLPWEQVITPVQ